MNGTSYGPTRSRIFELIAGKLTEDIPAFVKERSGHGPVDVIVDVRHAEVAKLEGLGLNALVYSLISIFCREYIGPALKKWSPRFFGDGALNLELFAKRRSEIWMLVKDDIGVVRKGGEREVVTQHNVAVINVANRDATQMDAQNPHRLLRIVDDDARTNLSGHYIRLPGWAFDAYGDLVPDCDTRGVVWTGNRVTFVASDGVSAQFQYDIRLDEIVAVEVGGVMRAEGALELERPPQSLFGGLYLPIPMELTRFLVPSGSEEIRLDLHCEWVDMRTRQLWEARPHASGTVAPGMGSTRCWHTPAIWRTWPRAMRSYGCAHGAPVAPSYGAASASGSRGWWCTPAPAVISPVPGRSSASRRPSPG